MTRADTEAPLVHGTPNGYTNRGCRCDPCKAAYATYRKQHRSDVRPSRTLAPHCIHCHRRIVGIPDGWKHLADNRQTGADGHTATPRTIR